ncbi:MAG: hypothetical protein JXR48_15165 [Candidatus Delongbacteria bacterium]|nr:hypothetical protein [Candidatus Delongbacteria bacterium]MBN2836297.1 hypothetical protein [Candidatus Delongbacteria bacterium]
MGINKLIKTLLILVLSLNLLAMTEYNEGIDKSNGSKATVLPNAGIKVHKAGLLWLSVSNMGRFGNGDNYKDPCTGLTAPSTEMPGGSGIVYLFTGALWCGGYLEDQVIDVNGVQAQTFSGPYVSTGTQGWQSSNQMFEMWPYQVENEPGYNKFNGDIKEYSNTIGKQDCDLIDVYSENATAEEEFVCWYNDYLVDNEVTGWDDDEDDRGHIPLGIEVRQKTYSWSYAYAQKFVILDYTVFNKSIHPVTNEPRDIYNFFMGAYLDCDIGKEGTSGQSRWFLDDLGGFIGEYKYIDTASGQEITANLDICWSADNDGRNYNSQGHDDCDEPGAGAPLDGAKGVISLKVLRTPNPDLRYAFNIYNAGNSETSGSVGIDWSPQWHPGLHNNESVEVYGSTVTGRKWKWDLTSRQLGYDDGTVGYHTKNKSGEDLENRGGGTEGLPIGDMGRYMVMSNGEFDYDLYNVGKVRDEDYQDPSWMEEGSEYAQAAMWWRWTTPDESEDPDGTIEQMEDLINGTDIKYIISFGPLGQQTTQPIVLAHDTDGVSGTYESTVTKEEVFKFAYGDSLKLTLAFIVNDDFHTDVSVDPNDLSNWNPEDKMNWNDAVSNVIWSQRVYDIPMWDTPRYKDGTNELKGDGWFGEDVGADGLYAKKAGEVCAWMDNLNIYEESDDGERDFTKTPINSVGSVQGYPVTSEDDIAIFGNDDYVSSDGKVGTTYDHGYMVKYTEGGQILDVRYGYKDGKITLGDGVPDFNGPPPPPSPKLTIDYDKNDVIVKWRSHEYSYNEEGTLIKAGSEYVPDIFTGYNDFEGYQIMISDRKRIENFSEVFKVDNVNYGYVNTFDPTNWLEVPAYNAHPEEMEPYINVVIANAVDQLYQKSPFGDNISMKLYDESGKPSLINDRNDGLYSIYNREGFKFLAYADPLDPIFNPKQLDPIPAVLPDSVTADTVWHYEFTFKNKTLAKNFYVAVTASDFGEPVSNTPAQQSNPLQNATSVVPAKISGDDDVIVVPNPYRADVDYEDAGWENVEQEHNWSDTDRKIVFMNVPEQCVIRIYTLAGDHIKTLAHNGKSSEVNKYGTFAASWNLLNQNSQTVTSGVYLFHVEDINDSGFDKVGKFVIIK